MERRLGLKWRKEGKEIRTKEWRKEGKEKG